MDENMRPKVVVGKVILQVPVSSRLMAVDTNNITSWRNYFKQMVEKAPKENVPKKVKQDHMRCYYAVENALHYGGFLELVQYSGNNFVEMLFVFYNMYEFKRYLNAMV